MQTPLGLGRLPPGVEETPPELGNPLDADLPPGWAAPLDADPSQCWADPPDADPPPPPDTVNKRAVRILLECILVSLCLFIT